MSRHAQSDGCPTGQPHPHTTRPTTHAPTYATCEIPHRTVFNPKHPPDYARLDIRDVRNPAPNRPQPDRPTSRTGLFHTHPSHSVRHGIRRGTITLRHDHEQTVRTAGSTHRARIRSHSGTPGTNINQPSPTLNHRVRIRSHNRQCDPPEPANPTAPTVPM